MYLQYDSNALLEFYWTYIGLILQIAGGKPENDQSLGFR